MEHEETINPLFNRREVKIHITEHASPPSMENAAKIVAERFSVAEEHVHVEKVEGKFGSRKFTVYAKIYSSPEEKSRMHTLNKKGKKKEAAK